MKPYMNKAHRNCAGFSMIEVLVAVVILAVGILGVAGLQGTSLRNTHSAHLRSQATSIAQDMIERMRVNRDTALANANNYAVALGTAVAAPPVNCAVADCTNAQLAAFDRSQWVQAINTLPSGNGSVTINPVTRSATVIVMWDNDRTGAAGTNCGGDPQVDLTCIVLTANP
jgi:type IV pilus assembly protein PilV